MKFTRDQKAEAFDNLPKDLKGVVMSSVLANIFQKIGNDNRLTLDKTGILSELVLVTILGLLPREELQKNLKNELSLNDLQTSTITKSINDNVFLKIREILQQEEMGESEKEKNNVIVPEEESTNKENSDLTKDSILAEIEDPTPAVYPISIADQNLAIPNLPVPTKPMEIMVEPQKSDTVDDLVAKKMKETVSLPSQKYSVDPYREPLS